MGKRGGWFAAVKKAITWESKEKKNSRSGRCFGKQRSVQLDSSIPVGDTKLMEAENEQSRHAYSVALVTAVAAEAAVAAAQAAAEVVRLRAAACKSKDEIAATKIQTAFRGFLARRALRALRGLARLRSLIEGHSVRRQAAAASKCLQTMARVQSEVRGWRIRALDGNYAQRHNQHKHGKELEKLRAPSNEGKWNDSTQSKERMESNLYSKQEAARRRERALAYAYSHQQQPWRNSASQAYMDPTNPCWVWNWLDRWMAVPSCENGWSEAGKEPKSSTTALLADVHSPTDGQWSYPPGWQSPLLTPPKSRNGVRMQHLMSPGRGNASIISTDNDSKSMNSVRSVPHRKHSIAGSSSVRDEDDHSLTISSPAASGPRYMASTESARAKLRSPSPLRREKFGAHDGKASAKRRLSFSRSPDCGLRRHSVPAMTSSVTCSK